MGKLLESSRYPILLLMILFSGFPVLANEPDFKKISVIYNVVTFPPFIAKDSKNQFTGIHINIAKSLFEHANIKLNIEEIPYARTVDLMRKGEIGMMQCMDDRVNGKSEKFFFPAFSIPLDVAAYTTDPDITLSKDYQSFEGKSVIIVKDWPIGPYKDILHENNKTIRVEEITAPSSAVRMIYSNRANILVMFDIAFQVITKKFNLHNENFRQLTLANATSSSFCIPKAYQYSSELNQILSESYSTLLTQGIINQNTMTLQGDNPEKYID